MTSPKDKHRDAWVFRAAVETLESVELFEHWARKRFLDEQAVQRAERLKTREQLQIRLRAAVVRLEDLQPQHRATFPMDKAQQLMGGG